MTHGTKSKQPKPRVKRTENKTENKTLLRDCCFQGVASTLTATVLSRSFVGLVMPALMSEAGVLIVW